MDDPRMVGPVRLGGLGAALAPQASHRTRLCRRGDDGGADQALLPAPGSALVLRPGQLDPVEAVSKEGGYLGVWEG